VSCACEQCEAQAWGAAWNKLFDGLTLPERERVLKVAVRGKPLPRKCEALRERAEAVRKFWNETQRPTVAESARAQKCDSVESTEKEQQ
jgi:hypothetical protein